jgi:predicted N-acyltransferase
MSTQNFDYVTRVLNSPLEVDAAQWNNLLASQRDANPFMRHEYLGALHASSAATPATGWTPRFLTLWRGDALVAACPMYLKAHSYGEYVFDWAWANAYQQHGLRYYPKAVVAVPFTPVPGARLMARTQADREALARALTAWCAQEKVSSLHLLFANADDVAASVSAGLMTRHTVQFHWNNSDKGYASFDDFLASLSQDKRKKIRQERRKVADAGVTFRRLSGADISQPDWDFFYRCYERTYLEHGNAPYLSRDFFQRMADTMPDNWLLFVAERNGQPIATSLIAINAHSTWASGTKSLNSGWKVTSRTIRCPRRRGLRPLLGSAGARRLPALRGLLLPAAAVVHSARLPPLRGRRPGRAQDGAWRYAGQRPPAPTGWRTRHLPTQWRGFWNARVKGLATTWRSSNSAAHSSPRSEHGHYDGGFT